MQEGYLFVAMQHICQTTLKAFIYIAMAIWEWLLFAIAN